jgi:A/G-specific adenine glycosylase
VFGKETDLWPLAERLLPKRDVETYTQALMDLGATVCARKPQCGGCPVRERCVARRTGRIDELPARRPKKPLPQKTVSWYIYRRGTQVLLERRPSPGIWGGLWSFPERPLRAAGAAGGKKLAAIEHGFTHFRLLARPVLCAAAKAIELPGMKWIALADAQAAAVPAPVKTLLKRL